MAALVAALAVADAALALAPNHAHHSCSALAGAIATVRDTGCNSTRLRTDKVDGSGYPMMYGMHLMPLRHTAHEPKILEIGLGCTMSYGPGRSARLWRTLLPRAQLWEAEVDAECVRQHTRALTRIGVHAVTGSQGSVETVQRWLVESGGNFDAVIDDGSHEARDVFASFPLLWRALQPGGLYFIEDIGAPGMADVALLVLSWADAKLRLRLGADRIASMPHDHWVRMPEDVAFINVFDNAVVIGKDAARDRHVRSGRGCHCNVKK